MLNLRRKRAKNTRILQILRRIQTMPDLQMYVETTKYRQDNPLKHDYLFQNNLEIKNGRRGLKNAGKRQNAPFAFAFTRVAFFLIAKIKGHLRSLYRYRLNMCRQNFIKYAICVFLIATKKRPFGVSIDM